MLINENIMKIKSNNSTQVLVAFMILCFTGTTVFAQQRGQMQRFKEERISFFNEKLDLSEEEAREFWPVQEDLHNRKMKINEEEKTLLTYYSSNFEAMSEQEIDETIEKFLALQEKRVALSMEYHEKFEGIIGKKKTMRMYALDREFRIHVLKKFRARKGGSGRGPHRGPE